MKNNHIEKMQKFIIILAILIMFVAIVVFTSKFLNSPTGFNNQQKQIDEIREIIQEQIKNNSIEL